jgi:tetratricopeptide (TPR) repeat protein
VDDSIRDAFKQGANAFHWIWDGLPPAERVVMAAMAEVGEEIISQDQIENVLNQSGVRLVARELKIAPMTLVEWDLLHPIEKNYQFAVPLLQQWVKNNRPLVRVKDELDKLDPLAENLYKSGQSFYGLGKTTEAIQLLRQALTANPNHLKSRLLLGRILLEQGTRDAISEAVQTLEDGYKYDTIAVGADLVKTLLAFADFQSGEDEKIKIYNQILEIQPNQSLAQEKINNIWIARGEFALQNKNFTDALAAFERAGDLKKIEMVRLAEKERWQNDAELALQQSNLTKALELYKLLGDNTKITYVAKLAEKAWVDEQLKRALLAEKEESWEQASQIYNSILEKQPDNENIVSLAKNARNKSNLHRLYVQAVQYMNAKHPENAKPLLLEILQIQPDYKNAARYFYEVVQGLHNPPKQTGRLPMSLEDNARKQTARLPMSLEDIDKDNAPKQTLNLQKHLSDLGKTIVVTVLTILTGIFGFTAIELVLSYITGGSGIEYLIALVPAVILMIAVGRRASYYFVNGSRNKL